MRTIQSQDRQGMLSSAVGLDQWRRALKSSEGRELQFSDRLYLTERLRVLKMLFLPLNSFNKAKMENLYNNCFWKTVCPEEHKFSDNQNLGRQQPPAKDIYLRLCH